MKRQTFKFRPSEIDRQLSARPELRDTAVAWALDYGVTLPELVEKLAGIGIKTSRSAASRWRVKLRPRTRGAISELRAAVVAKVIATPTHQLDKLAAQLGVRRT